MTTNLLHHEIHQKAHHQEWLLLVHGAGGSTRTWKRQIEELGAAYNLLIIDLPGHGMSADKIDIPQYSFESIATEIWKVVDALDIVKIHLVGISLGTILCLQMRDLQPKRVLSLVLPGAIVKLSTKLKALARLSLALAKLIGYQRFYKMSAKIMLPRKNHKQSRDIFVRESQVLTTEEFIKWTQMYYRLNKTLKGLFKQNTSIPHYLIMGSQDHLFINPAKRFASKHQNAKISVIDSCGHVVSIERANEFNSLCLVFLKSLKA